MFCIAAFIVLVILSIFSASNRKLVGKAWHCVTRRVTFRPCDTSFKEEVKAKLLSPVANHTPKLVKTADIAIEVVSFLIVILTIWSLLVVLKSGLDIFVWGTCTPDNASSCSLSSETCSITSGREDFWQLVKEGKPFQWFVDEANSIGNTVANIPTRLQNWKAEDYLPQNASYYYTFDKTKPIALEVIDPGCSVCAQLFKNIKQSGLENKYNLAYIAFPIQSSTTTGQYKFANSYTVTKYLEAIKIHPLNGLKTPADWQIIDRIFTTNDSDGISYQIKINKMLDQKQTVTLIHNWLAQIGYSDDQIQQISNEADSQKVASIIQQNQTIVKDKIHTVKIPTLIYNGHRHDGLTKAQDLK
jgi:hypothetical protein